MASETWADIALEFEVADLCRLASPSGVVEYARVSAILADTIQLTNGFVAPLSETVVNETWAVLMRSIAWPTTAPTKLQVRHDSAGNWRTTTAD
jgi:hypothetical protein